MTLDTYGIYVSVSGVEGALSALEMELHNEPNIGLYL